MWSNTDTLISTNKESEIIHQNFRIYLAVPVLLDTFAHLLRDEGRLYRKIHHEAINISYSSICVKHGRNFQCIRDTLVHLSSASVNEWQVKSANK
jgi:hypothetical protein